MDNSDKAVHEQWATPLPAAIALLGVGVALGAAAAASYADPPAVVFIGVAALAAFGMGLVSLLRRPRLTLLSGPRLVVKTLFRGTWEIDTAEVERVSVLHTRRIVGRTRQLVIDLPDDRLLVFGRWDLGEEPTVVVEKLRVAGFNAE
ncbi:PH domain-containing protein [Gordonia phthalatica]|uniref:PH domain-containing protein n=1 Tax=Gordonia phthalatica TaxID=1136941 RepID=UPI001D047F20|nr:PH domain-containing protein [Gordonia phthalatica]